MNADEHTKKSQLDKFKEAQRELQTDQSQEHFDAAIKKIGRTPLPRPGDPLAEKKKRMGTRRLKGIFP
jgi:hypothetical protein